MTVLMIAAEKGFKEIVNALLQGGADAKATDK